MTPIITDQGDGILLQFDFENGLALAIKQSDEAAQEMINIIQNKLNARLKDPGATITKTFFLPRDQNYDGDEEFLHWIEENVFTVDRPGQFWQVKENTKISITIDRVK